VVLDLPVNRLPFWDVLQKKYVVEPGEFEVMVGGSSDKLPVKVLFTVVPSVAKGG